MEALKHLAFAPRHATLAERLASSHADLHLAVELVGRRGCAPETAAEILL